MKDFFGFAFALVFYFVTKNNAYFLVESPFLIYHWYHCASGTVFFSVDYKFIEINVCPWVGLFAIHIIYQILFYFLLPSRSKVGDWDGCGGWG